MIERDPPIGDICEDPKIENGEKKEGNEVDKQWVEEIVELKLERRFRTETV